ncbi:unnamed protein product, partial [Didymodactylos carnosus]
MKPGGLDTDIEQQKLTASLKTMSPPPTSDQQTLLPSIQLNGHCNGHTTNYDEETTTMSKLTSDDSSRVDNKDRENSDYDDNNNNTSTLSIDHSETTTTSQSSSSSITTVTPSTINGTTDNLAVVQEISFNIRIQAPQLDVFDLPVTSSELVQEIHQVLMDKEETCHRTCFSLQLDNVVLDNFTELKNIDNLKEGSLLKVVE